MSLMSDESDVWPAGLFTIYYRYILAKFNIDLDYRKQKESWFDEGVKTVIF